MAPRKLFKKDQNLNLLDGAAYWSPRGGGRNPNQLPQGSHQAGDRAAVG